MATVIFLKLISYAHTNTVLRERWLSGENKQQQPGGSSSSGGTKPRAKSVYAQDVKFTRKNSMATIPFIASEDSTAYPKNVTLKNMVLFILFPTLCYQVRRC